MPIDSALQILICSHTDSRCLHYMQLIKEGTFKNSTFVNSYFALPVRCLCYVLVSVQQVMMVRYDPGGTSG